MHHFNSFYTLIDLQKVSDYRIIKNESTDKGVRLNEKSNYSA